MSCSMCGLVVGWGRAVLLLTAGLAGAAEISFDRDVRPILAEHCFTCHGPDAGSINGNGHIPGTGSINGTGHIHNAGTFSGTVRRYGTGGDSTGAQGGRQP